MIAVKANKPHAGYSNYGSPIIVLNPLASNEKRASPCCNTANGKNKVATVSATIISR